jgi:hypothetical protein
MNVTLFISVKLFTKFNFIKQLRNALNNLSFVLSFSKHVLLVNVRSLLEVAMLLCCMIHFIGSLFYLTTVYRHFLPARLLINVTYFIRLPTRAAN